MLALLFNNYLPKLPSTDAFRPCRTQNYWRIRVLSVQVTPHFCFKKGQFILSLCSLLCMLTLPSYGSILKKLRICITQLGYQGDITHLKNAYYGASLII
ncbi:hypothetical protein K445DRAFT_161848 [Daldinia sp. EC12]|nr:hypothetical protein K445DRAFT_161848 [Daldinia sp. EC12]